MLKASIYTDPALRPKLDPSYYHLQPDELSFFQRITCINDEDLLKKHILSVQAKAYEVGLVGYDVSCDSHLRSSMVIPVSSGSRF